MKVGFIYNFLRSDEINPPIETEEEHTLPKKRIEIWDGRVWAIYEPNLSTPSSIKTNQKMNWHIRLEHQRRGSQIYDSHTPTDDLGRWSRADWQGEGSGSPFQITIHNPRMPERPKDRQRKKQMQSHNMNKSCEWVVPYPFIFFTSVSSNYPKRLTISLTLVSAIITYPLGKTHSLLPRHKQIFRSALLFFISSGRKGTATLLLIGIKSQAKSSLQFIRELGPA